MITRLESSGDYSRDFKTRYPDGLTEANIKDALAIYQRSLYTPDSPFDRFLRGERGALTEVEARGFRLFLDLGCVRCHQGIGMGGNMFQRMGAKNVYFGQNSAAEQVPDYGRYAVTAVEADRFRFKVPSLRNVAVTPPYFHDGTVPTLQAAVKVMARNQLARERWRSLSAWGSTPDRLWLATLAVRRAWITRSSVTTSMWRAASRGPARRVWCSSVTRRPMGSFKIMSRLSPWNR